MNIRRYVANDMREALTAIRTELGSPMPSCCRAASCRTASKSSRPIDYDDSLFAGANADTNADAASATQLDAYEQVARQLASGAPRALPLQPPAPAPAPAPAVVTSCPAPAAVAAAQAASARGRRGGRIVGRARDQGSAPSARDAAREPRLERSESPSAGACAPAARAREARRRLGAGAPSSPTRYRPRLNYQEAMRLAVRRFGERLPLVDVGHGRGRRRVRARRPDRRRQDDEHRQDCGALRAAPQRG